MHVRKLVSHKGLPYIYLMSTKTFKRQFGKENFVLHLEHLYSFCIKSHFLVVFVYRVSHSARNNCTFQPLGESSMLEGHTVSTFVTLNNFTLELKRIYYYFIIFVFVIPSFLQLLVSGFWHHIIILFSSSTK